MNLSEIRALLDERRLRPTKSLGQNFLHDSNQLRRIADAASVAAGVRVLEIGPGLGALTEVLLERGARVLAIEKDRGLFEFLREKFAGVAGLELLHDDALRCLKEPRSWSGWTLASNLPYSTASAMLVELARAPEPPDRLVATLQLEVAQRIEAATNSEHYGLLSLLLQLRYETDGWFKIPPACFYPAPEVDSACLTLRLRARPLLTPARQPLFAAIVKRGFSQRRKMMFKLLKQDWPLDRLSAAYEAAGLTPDLRAEAVSLAQFIALTENLAGPESKIP